MIAKFTCIDGKRDDLYAGLAPMMDHVGSEEGTLLYQLLEDPNDANVAYMYELYADGDALQALSRARSARAEPVLDAEKCRVIATENLAFVLREEPVRPVVEPRRGMRAEIEISVDGAILPYKEDVEARCAGLERQALRARLVDLVKRTQCRAGKWPATLRHGAFFSPPILQTSFHSSSRTGCTERRELLASTIS